MQNLINTRYFKNEISKLSLWDNIVFCDIDWTIYRNSLFLDLLELLIKDWYVSQNKITKYNKYKNAWKNREMSYDDFLMYGVIEIFENLIKSKKFEKSEMIKYSNYIIKNNWKLILTYTMNELKRLQKIWYKIIFISWSPLEIVKLFVKMYDFDLWFWTYLVSDKNGIYTGERDVLASTKNKIFLINYIKQLISPNNVISFWDTNWDYDMIISWDYWVAVNPSKELYSKIKNNENVLVVIERKDLILELKKEDRDYIIFY